MKPIIAFYKKFLEDVGLEILDTGDIMIKSGMDDELTPLKVTIKRESGTGDTLISRAMSMYLPINELMEREEDFSHGYFHPACESNFRGQSEVFNKSVQLAGLTYYRYVVSTIDALLVVASNKSEHAKLPLELMEVVSELPDVSASTVNSWRKLVKSCGNITGKQAMVKLQPAREGEIGGVRYARTCKVTAPILDSGDLYGVAMSQTAKLCITKAFNLVLGELPYCGSNSPTAPYFLSFAQAYNDAMSQVKEVAKVLSGHIQDSYEFKGGWSTSLAKVHDWYKMDFYHQLEGNIGAGKDIAAKPSSVSVSLEPLQMNTGIPMEPVNSGPPAAVAHTQQVTSPVTPAPTPVAPTTNGVPTFKLPTAMPAQNMQMPPQQYHPPQQMAPQQQYHPPQQMAPQPQQYPQQQGYPQPQQYPQQQGYPQQQYPQQQGYPQQQYPQQQGYPQQQQAPGQAGMFYDPRTKTMRSTGTPTQPHAQQMQYGPIPGYEGPYAGQNGAPYYIHQQSRQAIQASDLFSR